MIELIGLKRFEFNSMIIFSGVTHENFYSLYRRALIILYQCRVYDPRYIEKHCGVNPASRGIFPRDPSLKKKLGSPGSGAVMVKLLRGFMEQNSSDNCVQMMEDYAMNGGDNGATRLELMKACNLNPEVVPHNVSSPETTPTKTLTDEFQFQQGKATPMLREANAVMSYMLDMCLDRMNANEVRKIKAIKIPGDPNAFLDKLCSAGHFAKFTKPHSEQKDPAYYKKVSETKQKLVKKTSTADIAEVVVEDSTFYIPCIQTKNSFGALISFKERET